MELFFRDFIQTKENLFFSVVGSHLPEGYICYLRYIKKGNKWLKIPPEKIAHFLKRYPTYLRYSHIYKKYLQIVPKDKIKNIFSQFKIPKKKPLYELLNHLSKISGVSKNSFGVTGANLINLETESSDIDITVNGRKNLKKVVSAIKHSNLKLSTSQLFKIYTKRKIDKLTYPFEFFKIHESRKYNRGCYNSKLFDILHTSICKPQTNKIIPKGRIKLQACIINDTFNYDFPAKYLVAPNKWKIKEIVCFTHTYTANAFKNEKIEAQGILEEVINKNGSRYHQLVIGSSRDCKGEYLISLSLLNKSKKI